LCALRIQVGSACAEVDRLRERLRGAGARGLILAREKAVLAERNAALEAEAAALRCELQRAAAGAAAAPAATPATPTAVLATDTLRRGVEKALSASGEARRQAESRADALSVELERTRRALTAASARARGAEHSVEALSADVAELRFQLRFSELQRAFSAASARKAARAGGHPPLPPGAGGTPAKSPSPRTPSRTLRRMQTP
jgi:chromosome segregation ATPase